MVMTCSGLVLEPSIDNLGRCFAGAAGSAGMASSEPVITMRSARAWRRLRTNVDDRPFPLRGELAERLIEFRRRGSVSSTATDMVSTGDAHQSREDRTVASSTRTLSTICHAGNQAPFRVKTPLRLWSVGDEIENRTLLRHTGDGGF